MWVAHQNPKYQPPWNAMLCTGGTTASCLPPWDLSAPRDAIAAHLWKMLSLYFSDALPYSGIMWTFCPLSTRRCIFSAAEYFMSSAGANVPCRFRISWSLAPPFSCTTKILAAWCWTWAWQKQHKWAWVAGDWLSRVFFSAISSLLARRLTCETNRAKTGMKESQGWQ